MIIGTSSRRNASELFHPGEIVSTSGKVIGKHTGLANYTIGQRKGLTISSPVPLYVVGKNSAANTLVVGEQAELGSSELTAGEVNWISGKSIDGSFRADVKIRYTAKEAAATVTSIEKGKGVRIHFDAPQRDITAGQAAVFYQGEVLVGGGIIQ